MKKMLSLSTLVALSLCVATQAFAAWDFFDRAEVHVAGVYSKPSNNGLEVGSVPRNPSNALLVAILDANGYPGSLLNNLTDQNLLALQPGFKWNYAVGMSYLFCGSQTRMFFDYEYFQITIRSVVLM